MMKKLAYSQHAGGNSLHFHYVASNYRHMASNYQGRSIQSLRGLITDYTFGKGVKIRRSLNIVYFSCIVGLYAAYLNLIGLKVV